MRRRNNPVSVWLTDKEYSHLIKQVNLSGRKIDPFIRELIRGVEIKERPPQEWRELLYQISAIGNNINQLAKMANINQTVRVEEIFSLQHMQSEIWQMVKSL